MTDVRKGSWLGDLWPLRGLTLAAQLYIAVAGVLAAYVTAQAYGFHSLTPSEFGLLLVLSVGAGFAQQFEVRTPSNEAYVATTALLMTAALILPPIGGPVVALIAYGTEFLLRHKPFYIELFNVASFSLTTVAAWAVYHHLNGLPLESTELDGSIRGVGAALAAALVFLICNHLSLVLVLLWARGVRARESDLLTRDSLVTDLGLLALGVVVAALWTISPSMLAFALVPFALLQRALHFSQLQRASRTDPKTGLANSTWFMQQAEDELARAARMGHPLSVLVADLDLLRNINSAYGHLAGDVVLVGIADVIRREIREYDIACRFGGEEFVVLLPNTPPVEAAAVAERIRRTVARERFDVTTSVDPIGATISVGVASLDNARATVNELLHSADLAVYRAKVAGRNRVITADPDDMLSTAPGADLSQAIPSESGTRAPGASATVPAPELPAARTEASTLEAGRAVERAADRLLEEIDQGPDRITPPAAPMPETPGEPRRTTGLVAATTLLALLVVPVAFLHHAPWGWELVVFPVLALLCESLASDVYGQSAVSLSAVPVLAAVAAGHPVVGCLTAMVAGAAGTAVGRSRRLEQYVFNCAALVLATIPAVVLRLALMDSLTDSRLQSVMIAGGGSLAYFALDNGLVAMVVARDTGRRFGDVFSSDLAWLLPYFLAYGLLGGLLGIAWSIAGWLGAAAFLVPPGLVRLAQKQYLSRTVENVAQLRQLAEDLRESHAATERSSLALEDALDGLVAQHRNTALALASAIDARDATTGGHIERVTALAVSLIARIDPVLADDPQIAFGFLLHDVGKIGVPDAILRKNGPLDQDERLVMNSHPDVGARIVAEAGFQPIVREIVATHHERWDGLGYPLGLAGTDIPMCSRVFAIADALDAMTNDRPYRRGMPLDEAMAELERHAGTQFDPAAVATVQALPRETVAEHLRLGRAALQH